MEYIYLLQEREFIRMNENVYKIGKTKQENVSRFTQYPKGSVLILHAACGNCDESEKKIINLFKEKYIMRTDIGAEYFQGSVVLMLKDFYEILTQDPIIQPTAPATAATNIAPVQKTPPSPKIPKNIREFRANVYKEKCMKKINNTKGSAMFMLYSNIFRQKSQEIIGKYPTSTLACQISNNLSQMSSELSNMCFSCAGNSGIFSINVNLQNLINLCEQQPTAENTEVIFYTRQIIINFTR
jgi:hypothetical protein